MLIIRPAHTAVCKKKQQGVKGGWKVKEMLVIECEWLAHFSGELEEGPLFVIVEEDSITAVQRERPEAERSLQWLHTHLLTPGFIDLHTHGVG